SGFPMDRIYFHGNNKSPEELELAFRLGVGAIVIDNAMECGKILALAARRKQTMAVFLRINPGVEAHTHHYIVTAHPDSKFGINGEQREDILALVRAIRENGHVKFLGLHAHIGSQIFEEAPYRAEIGKLAELAEFLEKEGFPVEAFNLGGGFAAYYTSEDAPLSIEQACKTILAACREEKSRKRLCLKKVLIEPGRSIVAEAGCTLYRVGFRKQTDCKSYVFVDGGMADNIRPALYDAKYRCCLANRMDEPSAGSFTVAGKCCESGDILIEDAALPEPRTGDLLAVFTTGAYGYSMASNYNRLGRPPVVFAKDGRARLVLRRETYEDMGKLETDQEIYI
ncbi:MAG: diaminopimelate decarboxylase, partial [Bacillota bacterium]|nr:diaminopimelate decarboxylase [Bacillota bacterium]